jgi:hypothetical protein
VTLAARLDQAAHVLAGAVDDRLEFITRIGGKDDMVPLSARRYDLERVIGPCFHVNRIAGARLIGSMLNCQPR